MTIVNTCKRTYNYEDLHNYLPKDNDDPFLDSICYIQNNDDFSVVLLNHISYSIRIILHALTHAVTLHDSS